MVTQLEEKDAEITKVSDQLHKITMEKYQVK